MNKFIPSHSGGAKKPARLNFITPRALFKIGVIGAASALSLSLTACGVFSDDRDRVLEGSLTLTPLRLPKDIAAPDNRNALVIPNIAYDYSSDVDRAKLEQPPILDTALASEMEKNLGSNVDQSKSEVKTFPVTLAEATGGYPELNVEGDFDLLWPYMENVLEKLGFKITDRNRSEHRYYISRQLSETAEAKEQVRTTGVERSTGTSESYQVEVAPKQGAADKSSVIRLLNDLGQVDNSALSRHMLAQIKAYLEQPLQ